MKATLVLLAIVGYLPVISSGAKSIHDWAHELGNKLGSGYSFREVQRDGRTCICSTTTVQTTPMTTERQRSTTEAPSTSVPASTEKLATTTEAASTSVPTTVPADTSTKTLAATTEAASTTVPADTSTEKQTTTPEATSTTVVTTEEETTTVHLPSTSEAASTTNVPTTAATTTVRNPATTQAAATTTLVAAPTTTFSTYFPFAGVQFGDRSIKCDDNVVPVANDRNAATKYSFSTPLYPDDYPENTCCLWRIVYPAEWIRQKSSRIITYNYSPDSYMPEECDSDFVTVYDIMSNDKLIEREEKCGHIGGQLGIIKHDVDERGAAFRVCRDQERASAVKERKNESTGKVAISFTVVAF